MVSHAVEAIALAAEHHRFFSVDAADAALEADRAFIEQPKNVGLDILAQPLWLANSRSEGMVRLWDAMKGRLSEHPEENWQVWIDWYEDRLAGKPLDTPLHRDIALIPDKVWRSGFEQANGEVAQLVLAFGGWGPPEASASPKSASGPAAEEAVAPAQAVRAISANAADLGMQALAIARALRDHHELLVETRRNDPDAAATVGLLAQVAGELEEIALALDALAAAKSDAQKSSQTQRAVERVRGLADSLAAWASRNSGHLQAASQVGAIGLTNLFLRGCRVEGPAALDIATNAVLKGDLDDIRKKKEADGGE